MIRSFDKFLNGLNELQMIIIYGLVQVAIVAATGNAQESTHNVYRPGLLVLSDKRVLYFVSLAKKTVAFFRISFSI